METFKGTPLFAAPQILERTSYSSKSDLYSIGVCLYRLATSSWPFNTNSKQEFFREMQERKPVVFPPKFAGVPEYAPIIDMTTKLMQYDEAVRISWQEFYEHPYMQSLFN